MSKELQDLIQKQAEAFEEFKKSHKQEMETGRAEHKQKTEHLNTVISDLEVKIQGLQTALNRTAQEQANQESAEEKQAKENGKLYKGHFNKYLRKGTEMTQEQKALSVGSDADGGYLVTPEMSSEIVKKVYETTPMRQLASVQTISTDALEILQDLDEAASGWVGEMSSRPETGTPQLKMVVIPVHEMYANPKASQKFLDDAGINVEAWLEGKVSEKFSRDENSAFTSGNGIAKPKGILSYAAGTGFDQIEQVNSASVGALAGDDFYELEGALKEAYRPNASLLMNRLTVKAARKLKDSQGRYLWEPALNGKAQSTIAGYPIFIGSDMPTVANDALAIAFGDFKQGYQVVDRIGVRVLRDPFTAKPHVLFYTTKRVGGGVKNFEAIKLLKIKAS